MRLDRRGQATETVLARFRDEPFCWEHANCIQLARAQGEAMGHDLPPVPRFTTRVGALRALKKQGVGTTAELLDKWFARRPAPAFALLGDLVLLPSEGDLGQVDEVLAAIGIADGVGNVFAWHASDTSRLSTVKFAAAQIRAAWALGD